jgi:hypothetical protein
MAEPPPSPIFEAFTPAVKACRDILVDDVSRHLGVPIIGTPTPIASISRGDIAQARRDLARAAAALAHGPGPFGPHVQAARELLDDVARLLGAPGGVALVDMVSTRQLRAARSRLHHAVDHVTTVLFDQPELEPG